MSARLRAAARLHNSAQSRGADGTGNDGDTGFSLEAMAGTAARGIASGPAAAGGAPGLHAMNQGYVHGYDSTEAQRLQDQAASLVELLHADTAYPAAGGGVFCFTFFKAVAAGKGEGG